MTRLAAVVLSAGMSSRLPLFKPLLRLGGKTMLERAGELFSAVCADPVIVVTGNRAEEVRTEALAHGMRPVHNPMFASGMFTSVLAGLCALPEDIDAVFILPVDIPLIRPTTVTSLAKCLESSPALVLTPTFQGMPGHPPLVRAKALPHILAWTGNNGLAGALEALSQETVPVADRQILFDVDDETSFAEAERRVNRQDMATPAEAMALLDLHGAGERGHAHARGVADAALALGHALCAKGAALDLDLLEAAALLHDIAKGRPEHEKAGGQLLEALGFRPEAKIVAAHRDIDPAGISDLTERELVYFADKLVRGSERVPVRQRFQEKLDRYADDDEACTAIRRRLAHALAMQDLIEARVGKNVQNIVLGMK